MVAARTPSKAPSETAAMTKVETFERRPRVRLGPLAHVGRVDYDKPRHALPRPGGSSPRDPRGSAGACQTQFGGVCGSGDHATPRLLISARRSPPPQEARRVS